ncbi:site-specific integrase [Actinoplanes sp. NPDC051633]|uniref:tyrosine-type recombinase/integrase n=1 Tax=Actinoplanes sp. NPDC051633 TaxID=3155670 RepID=UPI0034490794
MARRANGEGTVYQRKDGRWEAAAYVLTADGTRKRVRVYGATREEAGRKRAHLIAQDQRGIPTESGNRLRDYLTYWLAEVAQHELRPRTFETYARCVNRHIVPAIGGKRLHSLTPADVRSLLNAKLAEGLAPRTVHYIRAVLRSALSQALREGLVQRNVAGLVRPPRAPRREVQALTVEEARLLLQTARTDRLYALWVIALTLGLRRAELLGLTWPMVDFEQDTLRVTQGVQRVAGRLVLDELKSDRSHRTLPLPKMAGDALRDHRDRQEREQASAGGHWVANRLVFCTEYGTPIDPRNLNRSFRSLLIRSRVRVDVTQDDMGRETFAPALRLHDLRHSCASFLLASGASPRVVMEILGHSGIAVTMNTYAHVLPTLLGGAVDGMDDVLG